MTPYAEVIGDPVAHSKSPLIHGFWAERLGLDLRYGRCRVRVGELDEYFAHRRADPLWRGCNVTIPHKEAVAAIVVSGQQDFGAINTVVADTSGGLEGHNTDVDGFLDPIRAMMAGNVDMDVALVGAGGAARAALWAMQQRPFHRSLRILVRRPEQAEALLAEFGMEGTALPIASQSLEGVNLLVNASPLGMTGKPPLPLTLGGMTSAAMVFDMVYAPIQTPLLAEARSRGMATIDGLDMLVGQARRAFALFFEATPPDDAAANAALRTLLTT